MLYGCNIETEVETQCRPLSNWQGPLSMEVFFNSHTDILFPLHHTVGPRGYQAIHPCFLHPKRKTQIKSQYPYDPFADCFVLNWSPLFLNSVALTAYFKYFSFIITIKHLLCVPKKQKSIHQSPRHQRLKKMCTRKLMGHRLNDIIVKEHSSGNCVWKRESRW